MTIREWALDYLDQHCMFPAQANAVVDLWLQSPLTPGVAERASHDISDYPDGLLPTLALSLKQVALEWIDVNLPNAWFRPRFVSRPGQTEKGS